MKAVGEAGPRIMEKQKENDMEIGILWSYRDGAEASLGRVGFSTLRTVEVS